MGRKKKVMTEEEFDMSVDPTYFDLDETKLEFNDEDLFDDEDDYNVEPFGWDS